MKKLCLLAVGGLLLLSVGCGTLTQGDMRQGPAIFGGVRMDIAILIDDYTTGGSKAMAALDLAFGGSIAFDAALLPISVINEIYELIFYNGITVTPPVHWDNPPPKYAPYSAKTGELEERSSKQAEPEGVGIR